MNGPGAFRGKMLVPPVRPSARGCSPAEKLAVREPGGGGTSIVFAGFSPTMAIDASSIAAGPRPTTGGSAEIAGTSSGIDGTVRGTNPRGTFSKPALGALAPATSGAAGKSAAAATIGFAAGATKPPTGPLVPARTPTPSSAPIPTATAP